jgi:hypothetical protein
VAHRAARSVFVLAAMGALYFGCTQNFDQFEPLGFGGAGTTTSAGGAGGTGGSMACTNDAGCNDNNPCTDDSCDLAAGTCVSAAVPDGEVPGIDDLADDCVNPTCADGVRVDEPDDAEVPDDSNECTADSCAGGDAINTPEPAGTPCSAGACNAMGQCAGCNAPEDCGGQDTFCSQRTCINEICGVDNQPAGTPLPAGDQIVGDCILRICDAAGGETLTGDGSDTPVPDGNPCTDELCINDMPVYDPDPPGTNCGGGNVCDDVGNCVDCVDDGDCSAPETCGGGGTPNECGCTPLDCGDLGATCGTLSNGCGGTVNCDNNMLDGTETDIDCGGPAGGTCADNCPQGDMCDADADCTTNFCRDGVCCNNACGFACRSCALLGTVGTCTPVPQFQDDPPLCTGDTMTCSGGAMSSCKLENGETCAVDADCASDNCTGAPLACAP